MKYNKIIEGCMFNKNIFNKYPEITGLYFLVKEIYDFINLITKDSILIIKLRLLVKEKLGLTWKLKFLKRILEVIQT
jgi:hypothetical protein